MKKKKVYLLSGPPASGKSTWIREHMTPHSEWISRDKVRFSIVKEDEEYFSHEDEVFDTFIAYINQTLEDPNIEEIFQNIISIVLIAAQKALVLCEIEVNNAVNFIEKNCIVLFVKKL